MPPLTRQPVHTVYGGAHLFRHDIAPKLGRIAIKAIEQHKHLLPSTPAIADRVLAKLQHEPVEDFRIDFEDGYGLRSDEEEDAHAATAAKEAAIGVNAGTLPRYLGIRCKSFSEHGRRRALRTLRIFFDTLPIVPANFAVTLPKITTEEQVNALAATLDEIGAPAAIEVMIETPEALRNLRSIVAAAGVRLRAAHFGPYDFTSSCGVFAGAMGLRHPLCTHARNQMLIELAGTGVWLSDGPTAILPVGTEAEIAHAWRTQWDDIRDALATGFYQGWDLHPAQLPIRYAAIFDFFAESIPQASIRLRNFIEQSARATLSGGAFDDAATAQGLRIFFLRAAGCGAITEAELQQYCGVDLVTLEQLRF